MTRQTIRSRGSDERDEQRLKTSQESAMTRQCWIRWFNHVSPFRFRKSISLHTFARLFFVFFLHVYATSKLLLLQTIKHISGSDR
ncbi:hypothetical protein BDW62DRAFT_50488 [Aspergillus aurantiobrunneus]